MNATKTSTMTTEELKAALEAVKKSHAGRAPTNAIWDQVFTIERELRIRGKLEYATYNED